MSILSKALGDFFGTSSIDTPELGAIPQQAYKRAIQASTLNDKQVDNVVDLFQNFLKNNPDPSAVAFELSKLNSLYPGVSRFEPGSKLYNKTFEEANKPVSLSDANYLSQTMLGRPLTGKERKYVRREDPSSYKFAGLLAANPRATLADFPTEEENKVSAYYGRMIPKKGGFTGERFSSIAPLEYTGGIG